MTSTKVLLIFLLSVVALWGCSKQPKQPSKVITVSITPWMGYYPLYFAIEKNIAQDLGVELRVFETLTLEDFSRANIKEHVDAFSLTAMELVRANNLIDEPIHFAVFMDYSNGADVIVARKNIASLMELEGKNVGYEYATLGHLFLQLALSKENIESAQYHSKNVTQMEAPQGFSNGDLDAFVTFPPHSSNMLARGDLHIIYDSSAIPYQIIEFLMVKDSRSEKIPLLRTIWFQTLAYIEQNPNEYLEFLSSLMNLSVEDVKQELAGLEMLNESRQKNVEPSDVYNLMRTTCDILKDNMPDCIKDLEKLKLRNYPLSSFTRN